MAEKKAKKQVILKRQVLVKAIVTEDFKKFLDYELNETVKLNQNKVSQIDAQLRGLDRNDPRYIQLELEKNEAQNYLNSEADQRKFIEGLELNSTYSQGPIDGMVTVSAGDNLYEKLGGVEVIVKDGVVQEINNNPSQFQAVVK